mgnify:CR=1 FL=1
MAALSLRLNPALKARDYREAFRRDGFVQVPNIFEPDLAQGLAEMLERSMPWDLALSTADNGYEVLTRAQLSALGSEAVGSRLQAVSERASKGFGFVYLAYPMISAVLEGRDPGHPIHALTHWINSREFLDFGQEIIEAEDVIKADAQATLYRPGDFLTLHDDDKPGADRRAAYTIGFTRQWRSDWGGQLLFHEKDGSIRRGHLPNFNSLNLFKVPQDHSVAPVAPYATAPRLSVVGWLRGGA